MIRSAVEAVQAGFAIFPVEVNGKRPHWAAGQWRDAATRDLNHVVSFWGSPQGAQANIGVACKPSQILVVDCDKAKEPWALKKTPWAYLHEGYGPMVDGEALLDEIAYQAGGVCGDLDTYAVRTGSGGLHLYYRWDPSWPKVSQSSPAKGVLDVRGNGGEFGGYVLGAGSRTLAGEYRVENPAPVRMPPRWIAELVVEKPAQPRPPRTGIRQPGAMSFSGLVASVENAGEGNRNNALAWAARTMCEEGASLEEAIDLLGPAAQRAGLPWHEIERTIKSCYRVQERKMA